MQTDSETGTLRGIIVFLLFTLGTIFIGPLEAVLGLALYWLVGDPEDSVARTEK